MECTQGICRRTNLLLMSVEDKSYSSKSTEITALLYTSSVCQSPSSLPSIALAQVEGARERDVWIKFVFVRGFRGK